MSGALRIADIAGLRAALADRSARTRPVILDLPGLEAEIRLHYASQLNRHRTACGCQEGGVALFAVLIVGGSLALLGAPPFDGPLWLRIPIVFIAALVASLIAKFAALGLAAWRTRRIVSVIEARTRLAD